MQITPLNASQVGENPGAQWPLPLFPVPHYPLPPIIQLPCQDITTQQKSLRTWPAWLAMALGPQESRVGDGIWNQWGLHVKTWCMDRQLLACGSNRVHQNQGRNTINYNQRCSQNNKTPYWWSLQQNFNIYNYYIKSIVSSRTNLQTSWLDIFQNNQFISAIFWSSTHLPWRLTFSLNFSPMMTRLLDESVQLD